MMFTENTANNGSHVNCKEVNPHAPGTVRGIHPPGPLGARLHVPAEVPGDGKDQILKQAEYAVRDENLLPSREQPTPPTESVG